MQAIHNCRESENDHENLKLRFTALSRAKGLISKTDKFSLQARLASVPIKNLTKIRWYEHYRIAKRKNITELIRKVNSQLN